jgi:hypothetical protein
LAICVTYVLAPHKIFAPPILGSVYPYPKSAFLGFVSQFLGSI